MKQPHAYPCIAVAFLCACATAQQPASLSSPAAPGVGVTVTRVAAEIARNIGADADKMPLSVQVPPNVAAQVCGLDVNALMRMQNGRAPGCEANRTSAALNQVVLQQVQSNSGAGTSSSGTGNAAARAAGMVSVDVSNVAGAIARGLGTDPGRVPAVVQVPLDVAAKACAVDVDTLAQQQAGGEAKCVATSTSDALNRVVEQQLRGGRP